MSKIAFTLSMLLMSASVTYAQRGDSDPNFGVVQSHYFDYPLTKKEHAHWKTSGAAIMHNNKVVIVPETRDKKGLFYSTEANPHMDAWLADIELHMGNDMQTHRGGTGIGLFYLNNIDKVSHQESIFGYSNRFEGLGVYLNTVLRSEQNGELVNPIQAYFNDGTKNINVFSQKEHICFRKFRNLPEEQYFKIRIQYEKPIVSVSFYNIQTQSYELCLTLEADLSFQGYFLLSGASGVQMPDHIYLKSFKLYDPKVIANNQHFIEARRAKAEYEKLQKNIQENVKDLISHKSDKDVKQDHKNLTELYEKIPTEHMNLMRLMHRVIEHKDSSLESYFEAMSQLPNRQFYDKQTTHVETIKTTLDSLSQDIETYNAQLLAFEREVKRVKGNGYRGQDNQQRGYQKKEVQNKQTNAFSKNLDDLSSKMVDLKVRMDKLNIVSKEASTKIKSETDQLSQYFKPTLSPQRGSNLYDLSDIDYIFDDLESKSTGSGSNFWITLVNMGMVAVIVFAVLLWLKLNSHEGKYK